MSNINDDELKRLLTTLQSSLGSFTNIVDRAKQTMDDLANNVKAEEKAFEKRLKDLNRWNNEEDVERVAELRQYHNHIKELKRAQQQAVDEINDGRQRIRDINDKIHDLNVERLKDLQLAARGDAVAAQRAVDAQDTINQLIESRKKEWTNVKNLNAQLAEAAKTQAQVVSQMRKTEDELRKFSWKETGKKVGEGMKKQAMEGIRSAFSGLTVGNAVSGFYTGLSEIMATGGDNLFASMSKQVDAVKLGLTPEEYIKMNAASRQTILTVGGANEQLTILKSKSSELAGHFRNVGESTKFTQSQMDLFARSGVRPSIENAGALNASFIKMNKYTGITGDAFMDLQKELANDTDMQILLRGASMEERQRILETNAARLAEKTALGMSTQQAMNMAKALAKTATEGPLDRIRKAAKMRALGYALGIEGTDEAANAVLAGGAATDQQNKQLAAYNAKASAMQTQANRSGNLSYEIPLSMLQKTLGNENTSATSQFNTQQLEAFQNLRDNGEKLLKTQEEVPDLLRKLIDVTKQVQVAKANPYIQAAGGVGLSAWDYAGSAAAGAGGSWLWGKAKGMFGGGAATTPATSAPTGPNTGSAAGKIAGRVAVPLAVGVAGYNAYDAYSEYSKGNITERERNSKYGSAGGGLAGALAGAKLGAMGGAATGSLFGVVGAAPGALIGALLGGAAGAWGGSSLGASVGGTMGENQTIADKAKIEAIKAQAREKVGLPPASLGSEIVSTSLAKNLDTGTPIDNKPAPSQLLSSESRADSTSPIGLQLSKMDDSNKLLEEITKLAAKQLETAEKQLAATLVSSDDKAEAYKMLASGNKFMTTYNTPV